MQVYHNLKSITKKKYGQDAVNVGDEGGFAPNVKTAEEALDLIQAAIEVSTCMTCFRICPTAMTGMHAWVAPGCVSSVAACAVHVLDAG